jgi:hypothetical protein
MVYNRAIRTSGNIAHNNLCLLFVGCGGRGALETSEGLSLSLSRLLPLSTKVRTYNWYEFLRNLALGKQFRLAAIGRILDLCSCFPVAVYHWSGEGIMRE